MTLADLDLDADQRAFQDTARDFAAATFAPNAAAWDAQGEFPVDALRQAAALGFAGIYVDDAHGGSSLSRLDAAIIFEELSAGCVSTAAYMSIHNLSLIHI